MFKNMKIEINEQQPLDAVVAELERLKYRPVGFIVKFSREQTYICTNEKGAYSSLMDPPEFCQLTTLAQLKEMQE